MRRRELVIALIGVASSPLARSGPLERAPVVGFLRSTPAKPFANLVSAFREGLREGGYQEGQNVEVLYRYADNDKGRLSGLAAELVDRRVTVIVGNAAAVQAVKATGSTIPMVFVLGDDPVKRGYVASLNQPGGTMTGVTFFGGGSLDVKRLELLNEIIPPGRAVALLLDPNYPDGEAELPNVQSAARSLGRSVIVVKATPPELETVFDQVVKAEAGALLVSGSPSFTSYRDVLVGLAARHRVPASYDQRAYVEAGGLMSYGADFPGAYREAGIYVARILSGASPAELPVGRPATFELVINLKAANELGLSLPLTLLARADEVIE